VSFAAILHFGVAGGSRTEEVRGGACQRIAWDSDAEKNGIKAQAIVEEVRSFQPPARQQK
jgi:hypothetical protein